MIYQGMYKDRPAVIVESGSLIASFLPEDGSKMASLKVKDIGKELLAVKPGDKYKVLAYDGEYVPSECSGFDDMFPTVDPYTPQGGPYQGITYPDHGETCRIPYEAKMDENTVVFRSSSRLFPIAYEKAVAPAADGGLDITYRIYNNGESAFPYLWAGHIMLQGEDGARVFTCFDGRQVPTEMMFSTVRKEVELPLDRLTGYQPGEGAAYKFYYVEPMTEGVFGLEYVDGSRLTFSLDEKKMPYLGIWFNNGEFQDLYSITPEPCTVPYDAPDRAAARGITSIIPAGETFTFTLHICWK
ncbi:MAG: hypothetical protein E7286_00600 [Lachnospiraceae bacterium]|nr:hypothetical protein [Lachnospiraceae bacterium]